MTAALPLVVRRGLAQARLLAAVLAVVVAGTVLLGSCALLLTTGQAQARQAHLQRAPAADLVAEVVVGQVPVDPGAAAAAAGAVLTDALAALPGASGEPSTWATSSVRRMTGGAPGSERLGYLAGISDLPDRAELVSGRWPAPSSGTGTWEAVLPVRAAEQLGVGPGDELGLGPGGGLTAPPVTVVLVGTYAPDLADPGWERDVLSGAGYTPELAFGVWRRSALPAYGPLVVATDALLVPGDAPGGAAGLAQLRLLARPDLRGASAADLAAVRAGLADARSALPAALVGQDAAARLDAPLARTLDELERQQTVTSSGVLVVALVGLVLAGTALVLAARLVTGRRAAETALLVARGAGRGRLVAQAAAEALAIALVAAVLAVPASVLLLRALTGLPRLASAGLTGSFGVTRPLVVTVLAGALLLAAVLVVPAFAPAGGGPAVRGGRRGLVARSGLDLLVAGLALLAFLQLRAHPETSLAGIDPTLVAAPVLCLTAAGLLVLRLLPLLQGGAERTAGRSRGLVVPLAAWGLARRRQATGAAFLLVLATASATFAAGYASTWDASQAEQADARVGADLTVAAAEADPSTQGAAVAAATGGTVSPATQRPVGLGSLSSTGDGNAATRLVAVDTAVAGELLAGRPGGTGSWARLTAGLRPDAPPRGVEVTVPDTGATVTVTGSSDTGALAVRPVLLVRDQQGGRSTLTGEPVPLDGAAHPVGLRDGAGAVPAPGAEVTVLGVQLGVTLLDPADVDEAGVHPSRLTVQVQLAGPADPDAGAWQAAWPTDGVPLQRVSVALAAAGPASTVTAAAQLDLGDLLVEDAELRLTSHVPPARVPVLLSQDLADTVGAEVDGRVTLSVGDEPLEAVVVGVVPHVPSVPDGPGVLADHEVLAGALAAVGDLRPLVDGWWAGGVADPAAAVGRLAEAGLPGAVTRQEVAAQLRDGPLRIGVPTALWLLAAAAVVLALTGTVVHTTAALDQRGLEVARLQGLGAPRRALARAVLAEHTVVSTVAVLLGAGVGALAVGRLAPLMTVSETGAVPVPPPAAQWPWPAEVLLVLGLLLGCAAVVVPVAGALVRRAGAAHLRLGDPS